MLCSHISQMRDEDHGSLYKSREKLNHNEHRYIAFKVTCGTRIGTQHEHDFSACSDLPSSGNFPPSLAESRPFWLILSFCRIYKDFMLFRLCRKYSKKLSKGKLDLSKPSMLLGLKTKINWRIKFRDIVNSLNFCQFK